MTQFRMSAVVLLMSIFLLIGQARAQDHQPAVGFESAMDTFFNNANGLIRFDNFEIAFAPEGQLAGEVRLYNAKREVVAQFPFFPDYKAREGVFGRAQVRGPADVTFTEPGAYSVVFVVNGKPATRMPFLVKQIKTGSDPFTAKTTWALEGYWSRLAYFTSREQRNGNLCELTLWVGANDLAPNTTREIFFLSLYRDGQLVAHQKHGVGSHIANAHYKRATVTLFQPHEKKDANVAKFFETKDLLVDGSYVAKVERESDKQVIRNFTFTVKDGKVVPLARAVLGQGEPMDYIVPRVTKKNASIYEWIEATWISSK